MESQNLKEDQDQLKEDQDHKDTIEDLINFFIHQKIDKNTLLKFLKIYKITPLDFNKIVIEKIKNLKTRPTLKINKFLDNKFLKNLKKTETLEITERKYEFENIYKSTKFMTYKNSRQLLNNEEIKYKIEQYFREMGVEQNIDKRVVENIKEGVEEYVKRVIDKCETVDIQEIKKILGKDKNTLNII
ncbi:uncharacterized protein VNE69_03129 [Vairimorpha necatrix]|uniref:Uncharacterized protein n=1 Tax=Vairimorpha necatrix TaxID=6039 RepID=A0AAX4JAC2_9MICR